MAIQQQLAPQPTPSKAQPKAVKPGLVLPTETSKPKDRISDYKWFIYGPPGIGKTSFANEFDNALILDIEGRVKHIPCRSIPIGSWDDIRTVYELLKTTDHTYKTLVVDTVDLFYRLAVVEVCNKRKIEHPSDEAYGKGSDMVKNLLYPTLTAFQALGLTLVFTSQQQEKEISSRTQKYTKTTCALSGSAAGVFLPMSDIVAYCHFDTDTQSKRVITFKGSDYLDAKSVQNDVVSLPDECEMDFNVIKSYFKGEN